MKALFLFSLAACVVIFGCAKADQAADTDHSENAAVEQTESAMDDASATETAAHAEDAGAGEDAKYKHGVTADAMEKADPVGTYGAGITLTEMVPIGDILANPADFEGKTVAVSGKISEVCPMAGCWIDLAAGDQTIRVKVTDGEIVFPLSAKDHPAKVQGVVEGIEMTLEEARNWKAHEAEEMGKEFDPATVTEPMTLWRIKGQGAEISS